LNFIFLVYHICTPTILGYVCFNLNTFEILIDFIAGFFDIESEPTSVVCAHDNHDNVEVGNVQVDLNLKGEK
jgi:hypothetical protein